MLIIYDFDATFTHHHTCNGTNAYHFKSEPTDDNIRANIANFEFNRDFMKFLIDNGHEVAFASYADDHHFNGCVAGDENHHGEALIRRYLEVLFKDVENAEVYLNAIKVVSFFPSDRRIQIQHGKRLHVDQLLNQGACAGADKTIVLLDDSTNNVQKHISNNDDKHIFKAVEVCPDSQANLPSELQNIVYSVDPSLQQKYETMTQQPTSCVERDSTECLEPTPHQAFINKPIGDCFFPGLSMMSLAEALLQSQSEPTNSQQLVQETETQSFDWKKPSQQLGSGLKTSIHAGHFFAPGTTMISLAEALKYDQQESTSAGFQTVEPFVQTQQQLIGKKRNLDAAFKREEQNDNDKSRPKLEM